MFNVSTVWNTIPCHCPYYLLSKKSRDASRHSRHHWSYVRQLKIVLVGKRIDRKITKHTAPLSITLTGNGIALVFSRAHGFHSQQNYIQTTNCETQKNTRNSSRGYVFLLATARNLERIYCQRMAYFSSSSQICVMRRGGRKILQIFQMYTLAQSKFSDDSRSSNGG